MDLATAGLKEQPFRTHGRPLSTVSYGSHDEALQILSDTFNSRNGLSLLQGPTLSGKTTLIRHFAATLPEECAVAITNGNGLNTTGLLEAVLRQFGYVFEHCSPNELLGMMKVFAMQQTASHEPPLLIIENAHALKPSALRALCELADLNIRGVSALKFILVSDRSLISMIKAPAMQSLAKRLTHDFHIHPMSNQEATQYLHAKLRAAGSDAPEFVFPTDICDELWQASGGWPGILDRLALLSLAEAETLPIRLDKIERPALPKGTWNEAEENAETEDQVVDEPPKLFVSHNGDTIQELTFNQPRLLIGRSDHNDIPIPSRFVSRHHALLVRHGNSTFLMDLNSTNGTFVNSRRVSNHILIHDDVIAVGHHRIKFIDPYATKRDALGGDEFADTVIMKSLDDMRRLLAEENTAVLPQLTENLPTSGM